jgi:hypothetical protein
MTGRHDPRFPPRARLTDEDLAVIDLVGRFIDRRERGHTARVDHLLAAAAEFGNSAVAKVRAVLACYEAMGTEPLLRAELARRRVATGRMLILLTGSCWLLEQPVPGGRVGAAKVGRPAGAGLPSLAAPAALLAGQWLPTGSK